VPGAWEACWLVLAGAQLSRPWSGADPEFTDAVGVDISASPSLKEVMPVRRRFPGAASLLPGLLTGSYPDRTFRRQVDDELTNTKKHHGITSPCHLLFCTAREKASLPGSVVLRKSGCSGHGHG